jgi:carbon storage regulator CsrA
MMKVRRQNVTALQVSCLRFPFLKRLAGVFDMQVISRSVNEGLVIGDNVRVTVLEIQSNYIRLAIETPRQAPYYREEKLYFNDDGGGLVADVEKTDFAGDPAVLTAAL